MSIVMSTSTMISIYVHYTLFLTTNMNIHTQHTIYATNKKMNHELFEFNP